MKTRQSQRMIRKRRIRANITGSATRPRLTLFCSGRSLYAQVIDDTKGETIVGKRTDGANAAAAKSLGTSVAALLKEKKIHVVVFDRSGYRYHGVVASFADAVREGGIRL